MPIKRVYWGVIGGVIAVAVVSIIALFAVSGRSASTDGGAYLTDQATKKLEIFPADSKPFDKSYTEWTQAVWTWFQEIPLDENPANDATGQYCDKNQADPNVWYLPGTFGGKQTRDCTVPADRALVILIGGFEDSYAEDPNAKTSEDLRKVVEEANKGVSVHASVDGVKVPNLQKFYFVTPAHSVEYPEGNVWNIKGPLQTESVAGGWTLVLKPLSVGEHEVIFGAERIADITATSQPPFSIEAVYHLKVTNTNP